jgi:S1-C subfamily serine protease
MGWGSWPVALVIAALSVTPRGTGGAVPDRPAPGDDRTFRPTVIVRRGNGQGSGTVIASGRGETLVLTAAHVARGKGPLRVEVHRYNLAAERSTPRDGWPRVVSAEVAALDTAGDVAVLRVRAELPFVAWLADDGGGPAVGQGVVSLGVDAGARLASWSTSVREVSWFAMDGGASARTTVRDGEGSVPEFVASGDRPFLITERAPVPGRSGGGLFLADGRLVGVCAAGPCRPRAEVGRRASSPRSRRSARCSAPTDSTRPWHAGWLGSSLGEPPEACPLDTRFWGLA